MKLRTKLKLIRYRERYLDLWDELRSWTHKHDYWPVDDQPRWKIVALMSLLWLSDILYYTLGPFRTLQKTRHNQNRFTRVQGISRTTTRPIRARTKNFRTKWKDQKPTVTITTQQASQLMVLIEKELGK